LTSTNGVAPILGVMAGHEDHPVDPGGEELLDVPLLRHQTGGRDPGRGHDAVASQATGHRVHQLAEHGIRQLPGDDPDAATPGRA
jgi:hypothetical protein